MTKEIDLLDEDPNELHVPGQKYAIISVVPDTKNENRKVALKIKGVFDNPIEAAKWVEKIKKTETMFDTYIVDMYKWLLLPPDNDKITDQVHHDKLLNEIIKTHREEQIITKQFFDERVQESLEDGLKNVNNKTNDSEQIETIIN